MAFTLYGTTPWATTLSGSWDCLHISSSKYRTQPPAIWGTHDHYLYTSDNVWKPHVPVEPHLLRRRGTGQWKRPVEGRLSGWTANMCRSGVVPGLGEAQGGFRYTQLDFSNVLWVIHPRQKVNKLWPLWRGPRCRGEPLSEASLLTGSEGCVMVKWLHLRRLVHCKILSFCLKKSLLLFNAPIIPLPPGRLYEAREKRYCSGICLQKLSVCSVSSCSALMIEDQGATLLTDITLGAKFRWQHPGMLVLRELFLLGWRFYSGVARK